MSSLPSHMANCGYRLTAPVIADGKLRRVAWAGRPASDKSGWYVAFTSPECDSAAWGDWRDGVSETWCSKEARKLTPAARLIFTQQIEAAKLAAEADREKSRREAESRAWALWARGEPAEVHGYLTRKRIRGDGMRTSGGELLIPLRDSAGLLRNVQRIAVDGAKRFVRAAAVAGLCFSLGRLPSGPGDVVIVEGAATAATVHAMAKCAVVAAMNAGNLLAVATAVRDRCPDARIIIGADDDRWNKDGTPRPPEKNVGLMKARAAAAAVRGLVCAPGFADVASRGTDWNDLMLEEGEAQAAAKWAQAVRVAGLDAQIAAMPEAEFQQRKPALTAAYRNAGQSIGPKLLDAKRKGAVQQQAAATEAATPAATLARIASGPELWHDQFGQAFATFELDGRRVNARVEGQLFRDWLRMCWDDESGGSVPPGREVLSGVIEQAAARARARGRGHESFVRIGWDGHTRWLDLGRPEWDAVRIDAGGWAVHGESPVKFVRGEGDGSLPVPASGGSMAPLWKLLNVAEADRCLIAGWLLGCLLGTAPAFGLNLHGSKGTAKSTATRILRRIVDPAPALTQSLSVRKVDELPLTCLDQWIPCFENISWMEDEVQDALCMLTTGLSLRNRKLYSDATMVTYSVRRPWIINGINNVCSRGDLAERAIPVALLSLPPDKRRTEEEVEVEFETVHAEILGALLDAVSLASQPEMRDEAAALLARERLSHRMADALVWITTGEYALGFEPGSFIRRLNTLQEDAAREALADHPAVVAMQGLLAEVASKTNEWTCGQATEWTGGSDELLSAVEAASPGKRLPKGCEDARKLGMWLKREADRIRLVGIDVGDVGFIKEGGNSKRVRTIRKIQQV